MMGSAAVLSIVGLFKAGVTLQGSLQVLPAPMQSIIHGDNPTAPVTSSTTSTFQPPIIATPGPPNSIAPTLESEDVAFLTEYLQRVINLPVLVTVRGSAPTITKASVTATLTQAPPVLASPTCHNGGTAFRLEDVEEKISSFCSTASKQSWTATQLPAGATVSAYPNLFSGGQGQYSFDVAASEKEKSLYLEAKFRADACSPGAAQSVDFRKDKSKWCTDHFLKVLNDCQTVKPDSNSEFWKTGGTRSEDCMQWTIGQSQE
ncbi:hypothetical protein CKM354_000011100 [Cercospora kikuchii]|nr:uncharacterized protein CKM354_000011100 [Cercospora kikuchii]GIZ36642.1 hypothetical protein CKM354_000011100 [Cercospora kikuchii]